MDENLSQRAYSYLHDRLVSGRLAPGSRLSNRALAKEIGVSFTPVREALNRLVSEGLLECQRGLGVFVPVLGRRKIEEIYELRETLECAALAIVCDHASEQGLAELDEHLRAMGDIAAGLNGAEPGHQHPQLAERFRQADAAFHLALLRLAGNRLVVEIVEGLKARSAMVPHHFDRESAAAIERTHREHSELLEALRRRDLAAAQAVLSTHLRLGRQQALDAHDRDYMGRGRRSPIGAVPSRPLAE